MTQKTRATIKAEVETFLPTNNSRQIRAADVRQRLTDLADSAMFIGEVVDASKLATNAVTETKISDGAISTPKLAAGAVTADKIAAGAVVAGKLATNAVTETKISDGAISTPKLATFASTQRSAVFWSGSSSATWHTVMSVYALAGMTLIVSSIHSSGAYQARLLLPDGTTRSAGNTTINTAAPPVYMHHVDQAGTYYFQFYPQSGGGGLLGVMTLIKR